MLLASRSLGDFGITEGVSALLAAAKIGLEVWKQIDSTSLAREANRLQKLGIEVERQIALEQLALLKSQQELAAIQSTETLGTVSTGAYLVAGLAALWIIAGRR